MATPWQAGWHTARALLFPRHIFQSQAQLSPRCERNGKLDYYAVTPSASSGDTSAAKKVVVFANDDTYRLCLLRSACTMITPFVRASEVIIQPPSGVPISARYVSTYCQGGRRHEYGDRDLKIVNFFLD